MTILPQTFTSVEDRSFKRVYVRERASNGGKYLAVTLTVNATSQRQLDALYRAISALEQVVMVL